MGSNLGDLNPGKSLIGHFDINRPAQAASAPKLSCNQESCGSLDSVAPQINEIISLLSEFLCLARPDPLNGKTDGLPNGKPDKLDPILAAAALRLARCLDFLRETALRLHLNPKQNFTPNQSHSTEQSIAPAQSRSPEQSPALQYSYSHPSAVTQIVPSDGLSFSNSEIIQRLSEILEKLAIKLNGPEISVFPDFIRDQLDKYSPTINALLDYLKENKI
ncbi:MAG TPA: hypothetical protein VNK26_05855 [Pyrinomonadaceae bacterium]|jgi:hypothetical protein|nr:hypothetical protein [Pyrinomonadaceae bacterium]